MLPSPPVRRRVRNDVTMVSEAVQTDRDLSGKLPSAVDVSQQADVAVRKSKHARGWFTQRWCLRTE